MQNEFFGLPIVTARDCFGVVRERGIVPWEKSNESTLDDFLSISGADGRAEYERFGPKNTVAQYINPHAAPNNEHFNGFRTTVKSCAMVIAQIGEYIPVTAEWKHGNERITLCPPAGTAGKHEKDIESPFEQFRAVAFREFKEETGVELESVTALGPTTGVWSVVRSIHMAYYPFLGKVKEPIEKGPTKFDDTEHLQMLLFHPTELIELIEDYALWEANPEFGLETLTRDITYAALRRLGYA